MSFGGISPVVVAPPLIISNSGIHHSALLGESRFGWEQAFSACDLDFFVNRKFENNLRILLHDAQSELCN